MPTYLKPKKYTTKAELTQTTIMIKVSESTLAKIDAIEAEPAKKGAKMPEVRGAKIQKMVDDLGRDSEAVAEIQRLQIQLASTKKAYTEASAELDKITADDEASKSAIKQLQEKLETAKQLADSRNKIIRSLMTIVNEVGF